MNAKQTRNKYTAELKRFFDFIKMPGNYGKTIQIYYTDEKRKN